MSPESAEERTLTAADTLTPPTGAVVEVTEGQVFAFVLDAHGRRHPLAVVTPGDVAVGWSETPGAALAAGALLLTGIPGTRVRQYPLPDLLTHRGTGPLAAWCRALGDAARGDAWVERVVSPAQGSLRLAPGECVAATSTMSADSDRSIVGWLQVDAGLAYLCGHRSAVVDDAPVPVPLTRGVWLTSGSRCRISPAAAPVGSAQWAEALARFGRLTAAAVVTAAHDQDRQRAANIESTGAAHVADVEAGVRELTGAVSTHVAATITPTGGLAAYWLVASAAALAVHDTARQQADYLISRGLDPIDAVASAVHAQPRQVHLSADWWRHEGPPLVARRRGAGGATVALLWRHDRWTLVEPPDGPDAGPARGTPWAPTGVTVTQAEAATIAATAWQLVPLLPGGPTTPGRLLRLCIAGVRSDVVLAVLTTVGIALAAFATPVVLGRLAGSLSDTSTGQLMATLGVLVLIEVAAGLWRTGRGLALLRLRMRITGAASMSIWNRMLRLSARWHAERPLGRRLVALSAPNLTSSALPNTVVAQLLDALVVVGGLAAVATTTGPLLAAVFVLIVLQTTLGWILVRSLARQTRARVNAGAVANGRLIETLRGVVPLRMYAAQSRAFRRWAQAQAVVARAEVAVRRLSAVQLVVTAAWPILGLVVVVAVAQSSGADFAQFVTAQSALGIASVAIAAAVLAAGSAMTARSQIDQLRPMLQAEPEEPGTGESPGTLSGDIAVTGVAFRYQPDGPLVLNDVTLHVRPGEQVAIVGASGCGKTTLLRIILGLEQPQAGIVAVDGRDMATLDRPALRAQIGTVLQSAGLFGGTIRDNVDMGRGLPVEELWAALDAAALGDDVRALPLGLATTVIDGSTALSGGQRQRLLIARALAGRPRLLILDEATSALDNLTQRTVVDSLAALRVTRIVVAHRLSTVRRADRIVVLADGRVAQQGSYDELIAQDGAFRDLARRQLA